MDLRLRGGGGKRGLPLLYIMAGGDGSDVLCGSWWTTLKERIAQRHVREGWKLKELLALQNRKARRRRHHQRIVGRGYHQRIVGRG